jgi:hypothetical protein
VYLGGNVFGWTAADLTFDPDELRELSEASTQPASS